MQEWKITELVLCHSNSIDCSVYVRMASSEEYYSETADLGKERSFKCRPHFTISQEKPLNIELWNYQPLFLLKRWVFSVPAVQQMNPKYLCHEDYWTLFIRKEQNEVIDTEPRTHLRKISTLQYQQPKLEINIHKKRDSVFYNKLADIQDTRSTTKSTMSQFLQAQNRLSTIVNSPTAKVAKVTRKYEALNFVPKIRSECYVAQRLTSE